MKHFTIGRAGEGTDVEFEDDTVSAQHAELVPTADGRWFLVDRLSTNGTFRVSDSGKERLSRDYVSTSDVIEFGETRISVAELIVRLPTDDPAEDDSGLPNRQPRSGEENKYEKKKGPVVFTPDGDFEEKNE